MEFGTGVGDMMTAHDPNDFEVGLQARSGRHPRT